MIKPGNLGAVIHKAWGKLFMGASVYLLLDKFYDFLYFNKAK